MLATILAVFAFQASGTISVSPQGTVVKVHVRESDSARVLDSARAKKRAKALVATEEHLATAFADAESRTILQRARIARTGQDSSLSAYEASTLQRLTVGLSFTRWGRERIAFRSENSSRVRWAHT